MTTLNYFNQKKDSMSSVKEIKKNDAITIELPSNAGIEKAKEIKDQLDKAILNNNTIIVKADSLKNIDLSVLQILYAFDLKAKQLNKTLLFNIKGDPMIEGLVKLSGINDLIKLFN